jgi:hypothetical protein
VNHSYLFEVDGIKRKNERHPGGSRDLVASLVNLEKIPAAAGMTTSGIKSPG